MISVISKSKITSYSAPTCSLQSCQFLLPHFEIAQNAYNV